MGKYLTVSIILLFFFHLQIKGQDSIPENVLMEDVIFTSTDSIPESFRHSTNDTIDWVSGDLMLQDTLFMNTKVFTPDPTKAVIYSAIFPGLGQVYNRKYWKLPLIYGGFLGLTYGVSWNGRYYNDYTKAFREMAGEDPRVNYTYWHTFIPSRDPESLTDSDIERFKDQFRRKKNFYRRNRDLCIISMVGIYAVCMIDAYVDAHLFNFDISEDISLRVYPTMVNPYEQTDRVFGVQCSLTF